MKSVTCPVYPVNRKPSPGTKQWVKYKDGRHYFRGLGYAPDEGGDAVCYIELPMPLPDPDDLPDIVLKRKRWTENPSPGADSFLVGFKDGSMGQGDQRYLELARRLNNYDWYAEIPEPPATQPAPEECKPGDCTYWVRKLEKYGGVRVDAKCEGTSLGVTEEDAAVLGIDKPTRCRVMREADWQALATFIRGVSPSVYMRGLLDACEGKGAKR